LREEYQLLREVHDELPNDRSENRTHIEQCIFEIKIHSHGLLKQYQPDSEEYTKIVNFINEYAS